MQMWPPLLAKMNIDIVLLYIVYRLTNVAKSKYFRQLCGKYDVRIYRKIIPNSVDLEIERNPLIDAYFLLHVTFFQCRPARYGGLLVPRNGGCYAYFVWS